MSSDGNGNQRRRRFVSRATLLLILFLPVGFIATELALLHRTSPPPEIKTFEQFIVWRPTNAFYMHSGPTGEALEALRRDNAILPSGPAGYVFDGKGQMIDWTSDSGDDNRYQAKYRCGKAIRRTDLAGARAWLAVQAASRPG